MGRGRAIIVMIAAHLFASQQAFDLIAGQSLVLQQPLSKLVELVAIVFQDFTGVGEGLVG